jgi:hypothetical protein
MSSGGRSNREVGAPGASAPDVEGVIAESDPRMMIAVSFVRKVFKIISNLILYAGSLDKASAGNDSQSPHRGERPKFTR